MTVLGRMEFEDLFLYNICMRQDGEESTFHQMVKGRCRDL